MYKFLKNIYLNSPFILKKAFANTEAIRRNFYRRSGKYSEYYKSIDFQEMLTNNNEQELVIKINHLLDHVRQNIPYYKEKLNISRIYSIKDIKKLPITNKQLMRNDINSFINVKSKKNLWKGKSSGSTGTPFSYFRDKNSMQFEYALYDRLYEYFADNVNCSKVRFSGVNIVKADYKKPPFWYFIKVYNQLQCSAYHIDSETYKYYIDAIREYKVKLGTGYASSWLSLAQYMLRDEVELPNLKAIVTDSEGLSIDDKLRVERAFGCQVYQTYGLGEVGMVAIQCKNGHYHTFSERCYIEVIDENGKSVDEGEDGEIVVTDLYSFNAPFIRYRTGDRGLLGHTDCGCGWKTPYIKELIGRIDDYIITSDGRKISRLGNIAKPAKGVLGMQLIQTEIGKLNINVLPSENFEPKSMEEVLRVARDYLGDMKITWNLVDELEKTRAGKVRYVIRKF